jgi:hypothetical protein
MDAPKDNQKRTELELGAFLALRSGETGRVIVQSGRREIRDWNTDARKVKSNLLLSSYKAVIR